MTKKESTEALVDAAVLLFSKHGYDGVSVQDIAKEAGVNVSLISYHFGGKEKLYEESLSRFVRDRIETARLIFTDPVNTEDFKNKIELWIGEVFKSHLNHDCCANIIHRDILLGNPVTLKAFENTFLQGFFLLRDFLVKAQKIGVVKADLDPHIATEMLFAAVTDVPKMDKIRKHFFKKSFQDENFRKEYMRHIMKSTVTGIISNSTQKEHM